MCNGEHLLMCLSAICMSSLDKCLFRSSAHFWFGCLFFWHWVAYIWWSLILCQLFHLLLFSLKKKKKSALPIPFQGVGFDFCSFFLFRAWTTSFPPWPCNKPLSDQISDISVCLASLCWTWELALIKQYAILLNFWWICLVYTNSKTNSCMIVLFLCVRWSRNTSNLW